MDDRHATQAEGRLSGDGLAAEGVQDAEEPLQRSGVEDMWDNPGNVRETVGGKRCKDPRRIQAFRTVSSRFARVVGA